MLIRSTLTCETLRGVHQMLRLHYKDRLAKEGDALGIIAAQSIGEPGRSLPCVTDIGDRFESVPSAGHCRCHAGGNKLFNVRTIKNDKRIGRRHQ